MSIETWADVGIQVTRAREAAGLSKTEFALRAGLERTALSKIESGARGVNALELARIARSLDLPLDWFVTESPVSVVSRRSVSSGSSAIIDRELDLAARDVELLSGLGFLAAGPARAPGTLKSHNQAELLALDLRAELKLQAGPLVDLAGVAEQAGLLAFAVAAGEHADDGAYASVDGIGVAVINSSMRPGRRRFTLAHELGHHLLADAFAVDLDLSGGSGGRESFINSFAAHLLLPRGPVTERWHKLDGPNHLRSAAAHLAVEFRVSWTAVLGHLVTLGLVRRPQAREQMKRVPGKAELVRRGLFVVEELPTGFTPRSFQVAALAAYQADLLGRSRVVELLRGEISETDLDDDREAGGQP